MPQLCSTCNGTHGQLAVQVDSVLSRLITLQSRIDATEELILLELGHRRNEIVSFTLVSDFISKALSCRISHALRTHIAHLL